MELSTPESKTDGVNEATSADAAVDDRDRPGGGSSKFRVLLGSAAKTLVILAYFQVWFFVYDKVNTFVCDPSRTIHFTTPYQRNPAFIQPYTSLIYVFGGIALPGIPLLCRWSWRGIRFVLCCYTITSLFSFTCYLVWPVSMVRPVFGGENFGERLMLWVFANDQPGNCFPSSHVFFAILGALLVPRDRVGFGVRVAIWVLAIAVCMTTITSGQHYFMDIPGGVVAALIGYTLTKFILPDE